MSRPRWCIGRVSPMTVCPLARRCCRVRCSSRPHGPVGVSGAVFMLPVQLSVLNVPNPAVTPTNLLVQLGLRFRDAARYESRTAERATAPGQLRLWHFALAWSRRDPQGLCASSPECFGSWAAASCCDRSLVGKAVADPRPAAGRPRRPADHQTALAVGVVGGAPASAEVDSRPSWSASGLSVVTVSPAALASTFVTSSGRPCVRTPGSQRLRFDRPRMGALSRLRLEAHRRATWGAACSAACPIELSGAVGKPCYRPLLSCPPGQALS